MKKTFFLSIVAALLISSCTQNEMAKEYGGVIEVDLPTHQKLVNVTWKDADLWYLTRPMKESEQAETYYLKEQSTYGLMQGTVILKETK